MNEELDSQLSAMFDDELPPQECELLARRLSRDERAQGALGPLRGRSARSSAPSAACASTPRSPDRVSAVHPRRAGRWAPPRAVPARRAARCAGGSRSPAARWPPGSRPPPFCGCAPRCRYGHRSALTAAAADRPPAHAVDVVSVNAAGAHDSYVTPPDARQRALLVPSTAARQLRRGAQHVFLPGGAAQPAVGLHDQ